MLQKGKGAGIRVGLGRAPPNIGSKTILLKRCLDDAWTDTVFKVAPSWRIASATISAMLNVKKR